MNDALCAVHPWQRDSTRARHVTGTGAATDRTDTERVAEAGGAGLPGPAAARTGAESGHGLPLVGDRPGRFGRSRRQWGRRSRRVRFWHGPCYTP